MQAANRTMLDADDVRTEIELVVAEFSGAISAMRTKADDPTMSANQKALALSRAAAQLADINLGLRGLADRLVLAKLRGEQADADE